MHVSIRHWNRISKTEKKTLLSRSEHDISDVMESVSGIIADVRMRGDEALREYNMRLDKAPANAPLRVSESQIEKAGNALSSEVKEALAYSIENVRRCHADQTPDGLFWKEIRTGIMVGEKTSPIDSVGFYVPRGRGSFPSMLYMMAVPAQIAGVPKMVLASPPDETGVPDAACLYVSRLCGITDVYAMGGSQAWAALAYGTETVDAVDKCLGPGSKYVAGAKRLLGDVLDCGLPAGPSESIIFADSTPDPEDIARNVLVEAEHGSDSAALLITDSQKLAEKTAVHIERLGRALPEPRKTFVSDVMKNYGGILIVPDMETGAEVVNSFATEHLQIRCADSSAILNLIRHAGEILLGEHSPFSAANYSVGANAVLPTGGHARTWSGLSVSDFKKRSSVIHVTEEGLNNLRPHASSLAEYEGFPAHYRALNPEQP